MTRNLFGTDGIRGTANREPMTAETALKVAAATAVQFRNGGHRHSVVIGKDTRLSGYMIEPAMTAGFVSMGMDVTLVGPMPTPAVAMLTRSLRADLGVVISASHNPYEDNGIKLFAPDGFKLSDEVEAAIERWIGQGTAPMLPGPDKLGKARRLEDAQGRYIEYCKSTLPRGVLLEGLKVVVDCANGAAYHVAPRVLWELGAEVISIGVSPDGRNINKGCGATAPLAMQQAVQDNQADLGIALDGDADRLILADEKGTRIDGDQVMALIARTFQKADQLAGGGMVATVMSNLGLERFVNDLGLKFHRTRVGDRYVVEAMRDLGCNLGGEQSGHIVLSDYSTTGDGLIAALQVLNVLRQSSRPASELLSVFEPVPQLLRNFRYTPRPDGRSPLDDARVREALNQGESQLGSGRLVPRLSGTEPLVRIMAEGDDETVVNRVVDEIIAVLADANTGDAPAAPGAKTAGTASEVSA